MHLRLVAHRVPDSGTCTLENALNSTLIKKKFGSYGVEVIAQEPSLRITSLYSLVNGIPVTRTLAMVGYSSDYPLDVSEVHEKIVSGGSLGQSFVDHGFEVFKETKSLVNLPCSDELVPLYEMMSLNQHQPLAYHNYVLKVKKAGDWISYASVTEVHSPEHLTARELAERLGEKDYYREGHPNTISVTKDFHEFLNQCVVPARTKATG